MRRTSTIREPDPHQAGAASPPPRLGGWNLLAQRWLRQATVASLIMTVLAPLFLAGLLASAQESATLRCRVEHATVEVDGETTFFLEILDVSDLYGYELNLRYSASRLHFEDADENRSGVNLQIGDFLAPDFVVVNQADNNTREVSLALTQLSPSSAVSGSGELARATLVGVNPGVVNFTFADVVLSDPAGVAIPVNLQNCSVEVTGGETTPETPTPETPTPTPTLPGSDASVVVEPDTEATLVYTDTSGLQTTIEIPSGAVTDTITLLYTEGTAPATAPLGLQFAGVHFMLDAYRNNVKIEGYVFKTPIQITLEYTNADVAGLDEGELMLYFFDGGSGAWSTDGITVVDQALAGNRLVASLAHLSEFATFAPVVVSDASGRISGEVFEDLNQNGIRELDEPGVRALVKLYLLDSERQWATISDSGGNYIFSQLPDGEYFIEITPLVDEAYIFTTSATVDVQVENGEGASAASFGLHFMAEWMIYLPGVGNQSGTSGTGSENNQIVYLPALTYMTEVQDD